MKSFSTLIQAALLLAAVSAQQQPQQPAPNATLPATPGAKAPVPATPAPAPATPAPAQNTTTTPQNVTTVPGLTAPTLPNITNGTNGTNNTNSTLPAAAGNGKCATFCTRRDIRNLKASERQAFFAAVKKLMEGPAPTKYDQIVKLHIDATDFSHNTAYFLPWHRAYLREFEKALQAVNPSVCLPFWNWAVDSQAPENSYVFSSDAYGGNGGNGGCVQDGAFAGWRPAYPQPHCLQRKWKYGDNLGAFHSIEGINKIVVSSKNYDNFRSRVETVIHPTPHVNVGGDLSEMHSPNEPLFWAHHAYIDYIWTQYQKIRGTGFDGPNEQGGSASKADNLQHLGATYKVSDALDHRSLCYDYTDLDDGDIESRPLPPSTVEKPEGQNKPDLVEVIAVPEGEDRYSSRDRSNLNVIRYPDDADENWCRRNKYDVTKVREYEGEYRNVYKELNNVEGYISPCALWKRPTLCTPLIKKKQKLFCDIPSYGRVNVDYHNDVDPYQAISNVKKRVEYCSPKVDLPPDQYRSTIENIVGKSAFAGAGSLKKIVGEEDINNSDAHKTAQVAFTLGAALVLPFVLQGML